MIILDQIVSMNGFAARDGSCDFFLDLHGVVDTVGDPVRARGVDAALLGAVTYREFSAFCPEQDPQALVNRLPKHVVSSTLSAAPWGTCPRRPWNLVTRSTSPAGSPISTQATWSSGGA